MSVRQRILAWTLEIHPSTTRRVYRAIRSGAAARCGCDACRNFDAARPRHYDERFRQILARAGVDPRKEDEVRLVTPLEGGRYLYAGRYVFCGQVLAGRPHRGFPFSTGDTDVFERISPELHVALRRWAAPAGPWIGFPCVRLEFLVVLPWVLPDPPRRPVGLEARGST